MEAVKPFVYGGVASIVAEFGKFLRCYFQFP